MKKENLYVSTIDEKAHLIARQYGLGLEIAEFCTAWNLDDRFVETDRKVQEKMKYSDRFTLHGPYSELFPCAIDPEVRKVAASRYLQTIQTARSYGIRRLILHGGYNPKLYFPCWYTEQSVIFWKNFVHEIPEGVMICLENVFEEEPDMLVQIVRQVDNPKLRMCLDVGHVQAYSQIAPAEWLNQCADVIAHFHIHNNDGSWDTHSGLTEGIIPMKQLLQAVDHRCPDATVTLELMDAEPSVRWLTEQNLVEGL